VTAPSLPDARGRFGPYGGQYVPEMLMVAPFRSALSRVLSLAIRRL